ncbi:MAG: cell envelope integrity protein TolA [Bacteroidota bacterium]|nr:cell envelope integrity protein TolA [Bacteroidota bacterium]
MHIETIFVFLKKYLAARSLTIIVPFLLVGIQATSQDRLKTPVKIKVEDGNFDEVSVVMKNNTTGETNTLPGISKLDMELKINCDYVISFSKPGYITKRIALNTTAPADRITQGFYPFNYEVILFKQYEGVNIVIFNQPVGKISYNRLIDDFDYDTDYTKQIQSALKAADEEIKKKQVEARAQDAELKKEAEKKKAEEAALAKADAKAKLEQEKKAAEEVRLQAALAAKEQKAQEEQQKKEAKANAEAERQQALAQMEEEERAKAKAAEAEEERKKSAATQGNDNPVTSNPQGAGEDSRLAGSGVSGEDKMASASASGKGEDVATKKAGNGQGSDDQQSTVADPNKRYEKGIVKAAGITGSDNKPEVKPEAKSFSSPIITTPEPQYEVLPDISIEEITEPNRTITKVTVRKNQKETIFSKVQYSWGGIYYFRQQMSISETLYFMNTGRR